VRPPTPVLWVLPFAFLSSAAADFGDPQVIVLDWEDGHYAAGATGALGVSPSGVSRTNWVVWVDECHRRLRADLLYNPDEASVTVGPATVAVPYEFRIRADGPGWTLTTEVQSPGFDHFLGTAPSSGGVSLSLELMKGAWVGWSFRLRGWEVPGEPACVPALLVNEVEANPTGNDVGAEWIELHNPGSFDIDAGGWVLESTHGVVERLEVPQGTLVPRFGQAIIPLPDQFLDNDNESVVLTNPLGQVLDSTPIASDGANDARTWQRLPDGSPAWVFHTGTPGARNA
jgi:hypothetical protein